MFVLKEVILENTSSGRLLFLDYTALKLIIDPAFLIFNKQGMAKFASERGRWVIWSPGFGGEHVMDTFYSLRDLEDAGETGTDCSLLKDLIFFVPSSKPNNNILPLT